MTVMETDGGQLPKGSPVKTMSEGMTLDQAIAFMRLVDVGNISGRISEWPGLREACVVVYAHLSRPAQAVDIGAIREVIEDLSLHAYRLSDGDELVDKLTRALSGEKAGRVDVSEVNERCQKVMRERGKPYPRTCYVCGLRGPCVTSDAQLASLPDSPAPGKENKNDQT